MCKMRKSQNFVMLVSAKILVDECEVQSQENEMACDAYPSLFGLFGAHIRLLLSNPGGSGARAD